MRVTVRKRTTSNDKTSLYLDIIYEGKRSKESLNLFLYNNPKSKTEQSENKTTLELADRMRSEKLMLLQDKMFGIDRQDHRGKNFIDYFQEKTIERYNSSGNYGNWNSTLKYLIKCYGPTLRMGELNLDTCLKFKNYLAEKARTKSNAPLSQNSRFSYYNKFKACLKQAYKEKLIGENLSEFITGFKEGETHREYLTFNEVEKLVAIDCRYEVLKNAFLFSCLTGLRWSDIQKLTWQQIRYNEKRGHELSFTQTKTKGVEYLPLSEQAIELIGERKANFDRVFTGLKYSSYINVALFEWVARAGIHKKITFHCARHTHAVLLLENGNDIYTVSKLLGHRELKTTQIYAKIVDSKKVEAVNSIPQLIQKRIT